jgi:hypothetical protein
VNGINLGRVIIGGLAAGVLLNCVDAFINMVLLPEEGAAMIARLNLEPEHANNPLPWVIVDFLLGMTIVFTYAGMRPRFGAGPKTGIIAGLTLWFAISLVIFGFHAMGIFGPTMYITNLVAQGISLALAGMLGGWLYKE